MCLHYSQSQLYSPRCFSLASQPPVKTKTRLELIALLHVIHGFFATVRVADNDFRGFLIIFFANLFANGSRYLRHIMDRFFERMFAARVD